MIEVTVIHLSFGKSRPKFAHPKIKMDTIFIDPNTGKETRAQRAVRISETQNGRKLTEKAVRMAEKGA